MDIVKVLPGEIEPLRIDYLNSLPQFQELYMEMLVAESDFFRFEESNTILGYSCLTSDSTLVEFYLKNEFIKDGSAIFETVLKELHVVKVYCKSFDFLLLDTCLKHFRSYNLIGTLFRDYISSPLFFSGELDVRTALEDDLPFLLLQPDGLFETPQELEFFVKNRNILLFHSNSRLAGCGFLIKVHEKWDYYDIGMWVHPNFRRYGYATQIISYLKNYCLENNLKPICGCAIENIASQKTLEKNGFFSKHTLIEFLV